MARPSRPVNYGARTLVATRARGETPVTRAELHSIEAGDQYIIELLKGIKAPPRHFREGKYVHVSDVISKCARKIALILQLGIKHTPERIPDGHAITYEIGDAVHDFIKNRFVIGHPDRVWARWRCACGVTTTGPMVYSRIGEQHRCKTCKQLPQRYVEVVFEDDEHEVSGSPDLLLYLNHLPAFYVTEVKSMVARQWDELVRPLPDHVIQGLFYWQLMRRKQYSMVDQFSILYVKKEWSWRLPYKEFIIKPNEVMHRLEPFIQDLNAIIAARDQNHPLPRRVVCSSQESPEARKCPVCVSCFHLP